MYLCEASHCHLSACFCAETLFDSNIKITELGCNLCLDVGKSGDSVPVDTGSNKCLGEASEFPRFAFQLGLLSPPLVLAGARHEGGSCRSNFSTLLGQTQRRYYA